MLVRSLKLGQYILNIFSLMRFFDVPQELEYLLPYPLSAYVLEPACSITLRVNLGIWDLSRVERSSHILFSCRTITSRYSLIYEQAIYGLYQEAQ